MSWEDANSVCWDAQRRTVDVRAEKRNVANYARILARRKYGPTQEEIATLRRLKKEAADAAAILAGHQAGCKKCQELTGGGAS